MFIICQSVATLFVFACTLLAGFDKLEHEYKHAYMYVQLLCNL